MAFDAQKYLDSREEERKKLPKGDFSAGSYLRKRKSELKREYEDAGYEGTFNDYLKEHNIKLLRSHGLDTPEDEQFKSYIKRSGSFAYRMAKERSSREGKYTSAQDFGGYRDAANAEMEELDKIAKSLKDYYEKYGDIYVRDVGDALSLLGESAGSLGKVKSALDEELNYWSRFKTEDDYKQAIAGEHERERLSSLNLDTIDRQIDALEGRLSRAAEEEQAASDAYARLASGVGSLSEQAAMGESYKKALDSTGEDFKFKRDRWKSELNALKRERDAAYRVQKEKEAEAYRANPEFSKYVRAGTGNENSRLKSGNEAYEHLSAVERDTYNYLLGRDGEQTADRYLKTLEEALNYRLGTSRAQGMEEQPVLQYLYSPYAGLDQFASGISQLFSEDALPTSAVQFQSAAIREDIAARDGAFGSGVYDMGTTVGNMAPSLLVSVVTAGLGAPAAAASAVGALSLGASAGGNAYNAARKQGYGVEDARNYALLIGASEGALQYALGGIGKLGGKMLSQPVRTAISNIDNAMLRVAADMGVSMASEGFEEYLQTVLEPVFRNVALGEENEVELWSEDAAYSFLMGAITAGLIEGPAQAARGFSTAKRGKAVFASGNDVNLVNSALSLDPGTEAYKLARKLDDGAAAKSNAAMGELLSAYKRDGGDLGFMREPRPRRDETAPGDTPPAKAAPVANAAAKTAAGVQSDTRGKDSVNAGDIGYNEIPARRNIMAGDNAPMRPEAQNAQAGAQAAHTPINTGNVANIPQRAVATAAKAVFNGSGADAEVTGVAAVEDGRVYVSLADGGTALAGDVSFDDPGLDRLYASASVFDTPGARAFVSGYDGSVDVGAYYSGFASIYGAARKGMTQRQAVNGSLYAQSLPPEARQIAYFAGQNAGKLANVKAPASAAVNTAPQAAQTIRRPAPDAAGDRAQEAAPAQRGKGGVERDFSRKLTAGQEQSVKAIDAIARAIGRKVHIVESIGMGSDGKPVTNARGSVDRGEVNAYFDEATNEYYISLNGVGEAYMYFALHESIHDIRRNNELGYENLEQIVFDVLKERGEDADALLEAQKELYPGAGEKYWREEVVANTVPAILTERRTLDMFIERIIKSGEDTRSVFEKLIDSIRSLLQKAYNALKGEKSWRQMELIKGDMDALERIREAYFAALEDLEGTGEAGAGDGGRFSINPSFEREYDAWNGKDPKGFFVVGSTSKALQSIGINPRNIEWDKSKIIKIKEKHPGMTDSVIKQVPNILEKPIVIMQSKQADSRVVLFGEVFDANHVPVLAVLELQPKIKQKFGLDVLKIASAYGKDTNPQKLINESKILYVEPDKNRTNRWLEGTRLRLPFDLKNYGSIDKIAYSDASVNNSMSKNSGDIRFSLKDVDGKKIAVAEKDILKGVPKSEVNKTIAAYIKKHIGEYYTIAQSGSRVYIGKDLPSEYTHSKYTQYANKETRDVKFKAVPALGEMIEIASNRRWERARHAEKHRIDAKYGFYKYSTSFAIPEMNGAGGIDHYNGYEADLVIRNDADGKKYLYDVISIKKSPAPWVAALNSKLSQIRAEPSNINIAHSNASVNNSMSKNSGDIRFSLKDVESVDTEALTNELAPEMQQAVDMLNRDIVAKKGMRVSEANVRRTAKTLLGEMHSKYDQTALVMELQPIFEFLSHLQADNPEQMSRDVLDVMAGVMKKALRESARQDTRVYDAHAGLIEYLQHNAIRLSEDQRRSLSEEEGGYGAYRSRNKGRMKLVAKEAATLDEQWEALCELAPTLLETQTPAPDRASRLSYALDVIYDRPFSNPYGYNMDMAALDFALHAFEIYYDLPQVRDFRNKGRTEYRVRLDKRLEQERGGVIRARQKLSAQYSRLIQEEKELLAAGEGAPGSSERLKEIARSKAALRKRYKAWSDSGAIEVMEQKARFQEWKAGDAAKRRESEAVKKYRGRIEKNAKELYSWLTHPTDAKHVPEPLRKTVSDFLLSLDFSGGKDTKRSADWRGRMWGLMEAVKRAERGEGDYGNFYADIDPDLIPRLEAFIGGNRDVMAVAELNAEHLRELDFLVGIVRRAVTEANRLYANARYESAARLGVESIAQINGKKAAKPRGKLGEMVSRLLNEGQLDSFSYFDQLGDGAKSVLEGLRGGLDKKVRSVEAAISFMREALKGTDPKKLSGKGAQIHSFETSGGELKLTTAQIMELYVLNKREQARSHIYGGGIKPLDATARSGNKTVKLKNYEPVKVTEANVKRITDTLTPEQKRLADTMQDFLENDAAAWGNEASMRMYGYKKFTEENYYPIRSDGNYTKTRDPDGGGLYALRNLGITKATVKGVNNPVLLGDIFDTFTRHVDDMATYNAFVVPLSDAMKWYNYRDGKGGSVKQSIERALGKSGKQYFENLIRDINGVNSDSYSTGLSDALLRNAKVAAVGANMRVVLQQPTAYLRASAMIDPKYLLKAVFKKSNAAKARRYSAIAQWKSWGFFDLNLGRSMRELIVGDQTTAQKVREGALWMAGKADDLTWGTLWNACELETRDKNPGLSPGSEEFNVAVGKRLSEVIDRTQVVDSVFHRSALMRSKNGLVQLYTSFMSEPTKTYNMLRNAIAGYAANRDKESAKKLVRVAVSYVATAIATAAAAAIADAFRDDDDEKDWFQKWVAAFEGNAAENLNPLNLIPGLKDVISMMDGYRASRMDLQAVERLVDTALAWDKYIRGESKWNAYKLVYKSASALSSLTGIPAGNLMRTFNSIYNTLSKTGIDWESETSTKMRSYETLYNAMIEGDTGKRQKLYEKLLADKVAAITESEQKRISEGKPPIYADKASIDAAAKDDVDGGLADVLMYDPNIGSAYEYRKNADTANLGTVYEKLQAMGFSFNAITKAINKYENALSPKTTQQEYGQMRRYSYEELFTAIRNAAKEGDNGDVESIYDELLALSGAADPEQAIKSEVSGEFRKEYIGYYDEGDTAGMESLGKVLTDRLGFDEDDLDGWVMGDRSAKLREAIDGGDIYAANDYIYELIDLGREEKNIKAGLTSAFKTRVIELYEEGDESGVDDIIDALAGLELYDKDGEPYYNADKIWGWIEGYEEKLEEDYG